MTPFRAHAAPSGTGTRQANQGFTIIEVMIVVAIMAILLALAGPSFTGLIERWRVRLGRKPSHRPSTTRDLRPSNGWQRHYCQIRQ